MELEIIMQSQISQSQKATYHKFSFVEPRPKMMMRMIIVIIIIIIIINN
jgi:hypothetical protein